MKLLSNKKGNVFESITALAVGVAGLAVILVVTLIIISEGSTQIDTIEGNTVSYGHNASATLKQAVSDIPGWVPIIIVAGIGAVLLGLTKLFTGGGQ